MFQIGFLGASMGHDNSTPNIFLQAFRAILAFLDIAVYSLVTIIYEILFNIADSTFFSAETIKAFYNRVQLILGVFMIFKLSISFLQVIIDPDRLTDQKNGMGKIVSRIITMLAMFAAIIPLNVPLSSQEISDAKNGKVKSFNYHLNQSGLLFGTMYSLQERILKGNVLVKLILGNNRDKYKIEEDGNRELENNANDLAIFVLQGFVRINLKEDAAGKGSITEDDYICSYGGNPEGKGYSDDEEDQIYNYLHPKTILDVINTDNITEYCNDHANFIFAIGERITGTSNNKWMFTYTPIISTVVGVVIAIILFGFCIDIAIRTIKLAVLRLIAPIPIISYIDPKSSENGSFAAWTKLLISTYADLFIRLSIIYFATFLVQEICKNGIDIPISNGIVGIISSIFIIIGIFYFARMAPKFIRDALGLKGTMTNIGLSGILAGAGALATGGGLGDAHEASRNARRSQIDAYNQGKQGPGLGQSWTSGRDMMAQYQTGNPKMTYDQMRRGRAHLAREGIDQGYADDLQNRMYAEKDKESRLRNINDKINKTGFNSLTSPEKKLLENAYKKHYMEKDSSGNYVLKDAYKNSGFNGTLDEAEYNRLASLGENGNGDSMAFNGMDAALEQASTAGIIEKQYSMLTEEQKNWGAVPGYREKYNSTRSDVRAGDILREGTSILHGDSRRQTIRNVMGVPGATIRGVQDNIAHRRAENVRNRGAEASRSNSNASENR